MNWKKEQLRLKSLSPSNRRRALEEIESGNVGIHPDPEGKREAVVDAEKNACAEKKKNVKSRTNCEGKRRGEKI